MKKDREELEALVKCPDCLSKAEVRFSRKSGRVKIECSECGLIEDQVVPYGAGAAVGEDYDED